MQSLLGTFTPHVGYQTQYITHALRFELWTSHRETRAFTIRTNDHFSNLGDYIQKLQRTNKCCPPQLVHVSNRKDHLQVNKHTHMPHCLTSPASKSPANVTKL
ncbi:hypothetical protein LXL04_027338 [Taraxacum kok-saghyz]